MNPPPNLFSRLFFHFLGTNHIGIKHGHGTQFTFPSLS